MPNLIVTEKPSTSPAIAKALGITKRRTGYLESDEYLISWCVGHLVELAPPSSYDPKLVKWSKADLPILPKTWQYLVSPGTQKQFEVLCSLMARPDVDQLVCATDAGREGELIFRLVYHQCGCTKPFTRLRMQPSGKASTILDPQPNTMLCTKQPFAGSVPTGWSASTPPGFFRACMASR